MTEEERKKRVDGLHELGALYAKDDVSDAFPGVGEELTWAADEIKRLAQELEKLKQENEKMRIRLHGLDAGIA